MKHILDLDDFSIEEVNLIVKTAFEIKKKPEKFSDSMKGKILATIFFEPSTRTQFSFQTAMYKLGGHTIGFSNSLNSSVSKGENFKDTVKVVSSYADILVIRHFLEGSSFAASLFSSCPVFNAGDGAHLHPTQTITDVFTILEKKKELNNLKIGICGDLKFGRAVNSLIKFLIRYEKITFYLISNENFKLSENLKEKILNSGNSFKEASSLEDVIEKLDVLYMTRIQKERFKDKGDAEKDLILLDEKVLKSAKEDLIVLHPLPRKDEISIKVDEDKRAQYFTQAVNGVFVRMALILETFKLNNINKKEYFEEELNLSCPNETCITNYEKYLPKLYKKQGEHILCRYCDNVIKWFSLAEKFF